MSQDIPNVPVKEWLHESRTYPGNWIIVVDCPYCGAEHVHGAYKPGDPAGLGHRGADCIRPESIIGYRIVL